MKYISLRGSTSTRFVACDRTEDPVAQPSRVSQQTFIFPTVCSQATRVRTRNVIRAPMVSRPGPVIAANRINSTRKKTI